MRFDSSSPCAAHSLGTEQVRHFFNSTKEHAVGCLAKTTPSLEQSNNCYRPYYDVARPASLSHVSALRVHPRHLRLHSHARPAPLRVVLCSPEGGIVKSMSIARNEINRYWHVLRTRAQENEKESFWSFSSRARGGKISHLLLNPYMFKRNNAPYSKRLRDTKESSHLTSTQRFHLNEISVRGHTNMSPFPSQYQNLSRVSPEIVHDFARVCTRSEDFGVNAKYHGCKRSEATKHRAKTLQQHGNTQPPGAEQKQALSRTSEPHLTRKGTASLQKGTRFPECLPRCRTLCSTLKLKH